MVSESADGKYQAQVSTRVMGPVEACWNALTTPEAHDAWFSRGTQIDLRAGGRYSNSDNDTGEFLEVRPPHRLSFTWEQKMHEPGSFVVIELREEEGGTQVTLTHAGLTKREEADELVTGGWVWALDSFRSYVETGSGVGYEAWKAAQT